MLYESGIYKYLFDNIGLQIKYIDKIDAIHARRLMMILEHTQRQVVIDPLVFEQKFHERS